MSDESNTQGAGAADPVTKREKRLELLTVALLGVAAVSTAWSGYQSSLWGGIQSSYYSQAGGARTNAAQQRTAANQYRLADLSVFENYIDATLEGNEVVADFYLQRFRPEFQAGFDAWIALDPLNDPEAPPSPFAMPEYVLSQDVEAERLETRADDLFAAGEDANTFSDTYTLTTLLFAAVLFFGAISEKFELPRARMVLLVMAVVGLIAGLVISFAQPITSG